MLSSLHPKLHNRLFLQKLLTFRVPVYIIVAIIFDKIRMAGLIPTMSFAGMQKNAVLVLS